MKHVLCLLAVTALLSACAGQTPTNLTCRADTDIAADPASPADLGADLRADPVAEVAAAVGRNIDASGARPFSGQVQVINYLVLSTGGQYGAFGSGFLAGWSENRHEPRPQFDIVTGSSAGGLIAPFVALGPTFDARLSLFSGLSTADIGRRRNTIELLSSPALFDIAPLEARLTENVDAAAVAGLAQVAAQNRTVLVGAVELESGRFRVFDLTRFAGRAGGEPCIEAAMLATSAIPAVFPPRQIDGQLYADAGLRDHVFIRGVQQAVGAARQRGVAVRTNFYIVVNGDLRLPQAEVPYTVLGIAQRSAEIVSDQGLRASLLEILRVEDETDWTVRAITAGDVDLSACTSRDPGPFDACVTRTLFEQGRRLGAGPNIPWLSEAELTALVARN